MELIVDIERKYKEFTLKTAFAVNQEVMGLLGSSGSGKSMTLRCIAGLETPTKGRIILNGRTLFDSDRGINLPSQKRKVGFLFQNYALFPHMTTAENIEFALHRLPKSHRTQIVSEKIERMHLKGLENRFPSQLSGGQQQRVALARALAIEPEMLLLDEPFSALDTQLRDEMELELLNALQSYQGITIFVSHYMEEVYRICKNITILSDGKITASGTKKDIFDNPPSLSAAKLTGCKNISKVDYVDEKTVKALDWGYMIKLSSPIVCQKSYMGIRPHHLEICNQPSQKNSFPCWVNHITEGIHTITVFFRTTEQNNSSLGFLQWEVPREKWEELQYWQEPWYVFMDERKLLFVD
ncbi:MAG: sulfate/molybdate ABC transporter ATP-binding protein [Thermotaleaceae bacterium]